MSITDAERRRTIRIALIEEHVGFQSRHDLDGIMCAFGVAARHDEEPWDDHHIGCDVVRAYYNGSLHAVPDLKIDVCRCHAAEDAVILEVMISGRQSGAGRGLPPAGRPLQFPLCGIFTFDGEDRLAGERIYYGRVEVIAAHPLTLARAIGRKFP